MISFIFKDIFINETMVNTNIKISKFQLHGIDYLDNLTEKEISKFDRRDVKGYRRLLNFSEKIFKVGFEKRHESLREQMNEVKEKLNIILEFIKKNDR